MAEEKFDKIFELLREGMVKTGFLERMTADCTPEGAYAEIEEQEILEVPASGEDLALEVKSENNGVRYVMEKRQMDKGAEVFSTIQHVMEKIQMVEEKLDKMFEGLFDWMVETGLFERKIADFVFEGAQTEIEEGFALEVKFENNGPWYAMEKIQMDKGLEASSILRNDLLWQLEKFYNINFWIFRQNQLLRDMAIFFGVKIRSVVLQNERAGGLSLPEVRGRKEGEIVKKGMG